MVRIILRFLKWIFVSEPLPEPKSDDRDWQRQFERMMKEARRS